MLINGQGNDEIFTDMRNLRRQLPFRHCRRRTMGGLDNGSSVAT